ncbi:hypothetical protein ATO6_13810 [Oceanicola sp. 22II-s10i]|uniref:hypothetical protein n=1 Tax=Oceanicola sp. 22II-s10i TaxID=1317116 RepID=UPI000B524EB9|nr:hypothetical protein [Oceanicola sp. 22II-s10i]OWU84133.1 hypothetical protein ATO6_13810 [Oceanicola sp. 22II-s10i]
MIRVITIEAIYPGDPDQIFAEALDLREMKQAMAGIARYDRLPDKVIEQGDRYDVDVTMWGWLKTRHHVMQVVRVDPAARIVQSHESNPQVRRWDHRLSFGPHPEGALWTDRIVLDAGWQTPITARFCRHVYRQRHIARRALRIATRIRRGGEDDGDATGLGPGDRA